MKFRHISDPEEHINVINFPQVTQSEFARLELETKAAESEVVRTSDEFTGKAELTRIANTQEVEYKTQILTDDGFNEKETTNRVDFAHPGTRKEVVPSSEKAKFIVTETIPEVFYEDHDRRSCGEDFREPDNPARDTMAAQWSVRDHVSAAIQEKSKLCRVGHTQSRCWLVASTRGGQKEASSSCMPRSDRREKQFGL